jgi:L-lactate dehydrogenase complex protein LldE
MTEVHLLSTCLAEEFFPQAIDASVRVLEGLRVRVRPVRAAFCCGQAAFNEGWRDEARAIARRVIEATDDGAPIVVPSGSCAAMMKIFYGDLFTGDDRLTARVAALRPRVFEFSQFIVDVLKVKFVGARFDRKVTYHPSCHLMRELRVRTQPMDLLSNVDGIKLVALPDAEECCGFGGMFSVKFGSISTAMMSDKIARIAQSGAEVVTASDCGCLMQIGGGLRRAGSPVEIRHLAEILASR